MQLSHREGFEVKVTEAISKGVPVVAYRAGGIPFQIRHGETGYLVDVGDTAAVARHLYDLCTDTELRERLSRTAVSTLAEEYFTSFNLVNWLYICFKILDKPSSGPEGMGAITAQEEEEQGEEDGDGDVCLAVDGSLHPCKPQLKEPTLNQLGGGAWVRDLWQQEFSETLGDDGGDGEAEAEEEALHPAHQEAQREHRAKKWFGQAAKVAGEAQGQQSGGNKQPVVESSG